MATRSFKLADIDLTTTVCQAGGPGQSVQAAQPTGALFVAISEELGRPAHRASPGLDQRRGGG